MPTSYPSTTYTEDRSTPIEDRATIATMATRELAAAWTACLDQLIDARFRNDEEGPNQHAVMMASHQLLENKKNNPNWPPVYVGREPSGGIIVEYELPGNVVIEYTHHNNGMQDFTVYVNDRVVQSHRTLAEID